LQQITIVDDTKGNARGARALVAFTNSWACPMAKLHLKQCIKGITRT